jgi:hypothetical protein
MGGKMIMPSVNPRSLVLDKHEEAMLRFVHAADPNPGRNTAPKGVSLDKIEEWFEREFPDKSMFPVHERLTMEELIGRRNEKDVRHFCITPRGKAWMDAQPEAVKEPKKPKVPKEPKKPKAEEPAPT